MAGEKILNCPKCGGETKQVSFADKDRWCCTKDLCGWQEGMTIYRLTDLYQFYRRIGKLTLNHDVMDNTAIVTAKDLGAELEKVNPDWWKECADKTESVA